nr:cation:dicarboxylase symporter family transporter [Glutamicibacter sp. ZJUTW]
MRSGCNLWPSASYCLDCFAVRKTTSTIEGRSSRQYEVFSLLFLAQAFGHNLSSGQQLAALGILPLASKGMAGVPGSSFLALSATAAALGIFPVAGVALLLGADRIMDSMRVTVNLLGNCVATFVVAKWEGQFDREAMKRAFAGEITNEDPARMLGRDEEWETIEAERIAQGGQPSPKFGGGPSPDALSKFDMKPATEAEAAAAARKSHFDDERAEVRN